MLADFMSGLLIAKPDNVLNFAKVHFGAENIPVKKRRPFLAWDSHVEKSLSPLGQATFLKFKKYADKHKMNPGN